LYTYQGKQKKRSRGRKAVIWIIAVLVLLVALDFGAKAFAENEAAVQIQKQGFPKKPSVSIAGFPFLTQVIFRDFHQITISSSDVKEGPVTINKLNVVATQVKLNSSFNGGTTGPLHGTVLISLGELSSILSAAGPIASFLGGGSGGGLKIQAVGSNELKGSLNLLGGTVSDSATWRVVSAGPNEIDLQLVQHSGSLPGNFLSSAQNIKIPLKSLPAGLKLTGQISSSSGGIVAHVSANSLAFGS
jgi:LmeA-like phospholipid-binding